MRDQNSQPVTTFPKIYGLGPINSAAILGDFRLPVINATTALGTNLQQLASFTQNLGISQTVKDMQRLSESLVLPHKQMATLIQTMAKYICRFNRR